MWSQKNTMMTNESRIVLPPKIVLSCLSCTIGYIALKAGFDGYLRWHLGAPLEVSIANVLIFGVLFAAVLYPIYRHLVREARTTRDALHKAINISTNAICISRVKDGAILKINGAFTALTGYAETDALSKKVRELNLWQSPAHFEWLVREIVKKGAVLDLEVSLVSKLGEVKTGLLTASMVESGDEPCIFAIIRDVSALKCAQERIEKLSYYDIDTGLPNQNLLMDRLNHLISLNTRELRPTAVIYVGMWGFKGIVDAMGHAGSNDVLQDLARRLISTLRDSDTIARLHGDELVVLLGGELKDADIDVVIAKIEQVFAGPIRIPSGEITISASLGIACYPSDGLSAELLLQHSHAAMNQAREQGDGFQYYSASMNEKAIYRLRIESGMMRSLEEGEFFLCYQPKYAGDGRELTGMEALVRWRRNGEIVMPDQFIPVAEDNGMIVKLGEWVLREACRQNMSWQREGLSPVQVSVNISTRQLRDGDFADKVEGALRDTGLEPGYLELEITESAIMCISDDLVLKLLRLKELGICISIDDFGTGYSSLSYLKNLPIDKIKIDRSFVMDIVSDPDDAAIVDAIISMAHALNLCVIAEGVESKEQFDFLVGRNCTEFQGYYFSKPLSVEHFASLLRSRETAAVCKDFANLLRFRETAAACKKKVRIGRISRQLPAREGSASPAQLLGPASGRAEPGLCAECMQDVARLVQPVSPQDRIINVLSRFQLDLQLKVLPVVEDVAIVGVVNRSTFFEEHIIGRQGFAAHINHAKKIRELMEPVEFTFEATTRIEDAAAILQSMNSTLHIDNICITLNGAYAGMIDVNRIFKAMTEIQIVLAKGANPLTGLPGNTSIERQICERLDSRVPFDIAYIDIDNFKPFNDYYGFQKGDEIIKKLAEIMTVIVADSPFAATAFCGHIGGDDFILISESFQAEQLSARIAEAFDEERPWFHGEMDYAAGGYHTFNRKGELESFPLISLSVGIVNTSITPVDSYAKLASLSTEVKKAAKKTAGTSIVVDGLVAA